MCVFWLIFLITFGAIVFRGAPYVPTHKRTIQIALDFLPLKKDDLIVDLGSGDGAVALFAAQRGYCAIGYELNPILNIVARLRCKMAGAKAKFYTRDFWLTPLPPDTKAVFVFLAGPYMKKLSRKLRKEMNGRKEPLYVISHGFYIPDLCPEKVSEGLYFYKIKPGDFLALQKA